MSVPVCVLLPSLQKPEPGTKQCLAKTPHYDSHSVLNTCTKVPLYNTCVTKINKHYPSLLVFAPKEKVMQSQAFVLSALLSLSLFLPPQSHFPDLLLASTGNRHPLPDRKPCCPSVLGKPKRYQLWKQCLPLSFYFNLLLSGWRPGS